MQTRLKSETAGLLILKIPIGDGGGIVGHARLDESRIAIKFNGFRRWYKIPLAATFNTARLRCLIRGGWLVLRDSVTARGIRTGLQLAVIHEAAAPARWQDQHEATKECGDLEA